MYCKNQARTFNINNNIQTPHLGCLLALPHLPFLPPSFTLLPSLL